MGVVVSLLVMARRRRRLSALVMSLLVVSPNLRWPPVRQRRVDQMIHRLEQVLDAMRRRHSGVAQVRDQFRGNVVDGQVWHRVALLGRRQRACHLVLEEARERGGHGPVSLRMGDALVL